MDLTYFKLRFQQFFDTDIDEIYLNEVSCNGISPTFTNYFSEDELFPEDDDIHLSVKDAYYLFKKYANIDCVYIHLFDIRLGFKRDVTLPGEMYLDLNKGD